MVILHLILATLYFSRSGSLMSYFLTFLLYIPPSLPFFWKLSYLVFPFSKELFATFSIVIPATFSLFPFLRQFFTSSPHSPLPPENMFVQLQHFCCLLTISGWGWILRANGAAPSNVVLWWFLLLEIDGSPTKVGTGNLYRAVDDPGGGLQRILYKHSLAGEENINYVAIHGAVNVDKMDSLAYPYKCTINDEVHRSPGDIYKSGMYARTVYR